MELKKDASIQTSDFWYDLTDGGYIEPDNICEFQADADKVNSAVRVIIEFYQACEEQIPDFLQ